MVKHTLKPHQAPNQAMHRLQNLPHNWRFSTFRKIVTGDIFLFSPEEISALSYQEGGAIGMVVSDGIRLQESRPAPLGYSSMKRVVLVRLGTRWFGSFITRKSQERTKGLYDHHLVHLEAHQRTADFPKQVPFLTRMQAGK